MSNKSKNLPAQILVLGMHRSGTSALTGALSSAGVFVGGEQELTGKNWENPKGFFERRDARNICDALLHGSGADWWKVSRFSPDNADHEVVRAKRSEIGALVSQLNERAENAWALKEPRLCVLLPIFRSFLSKPFAIIVARHPVEVARSLRRRNGFPIAVGMALWEAYMCPAMQHAADLQHFVVRYDEILDEPERLFAELFEWLEQRGVSGLDATAAINSISPELRRERARDEDGKLLTRAQEALWKRLSDRQISDPPPVLSPAAQGLLHEFESDQAVVERLRARTLEQNRELKRSSEKLDRLQSDLQNHRETEKKLEQRLTRASGLEDELAQAKSHIETLKSELAQTHTRLEELEPLRDRLGQREQALAGAREQIDALQAASNKQEERVKELEPLRQEAAKREAEFTQAEEHIETLKSELAQTHTRLEQLEPLRDRLGQREQELAGTREQIDALQAASSKQEERLRELEPLREEAAKRAAELAQAEGRIETLKSELAQTHTRLEELEPLRDQLGKREQELAGAKEEQQKLEQANLEIAKVRDKLQSDAERYKAREREQSEKIREQELLLKRQNDRIGLLETQLERLSGSRALQITNRLQFLPLNPFGWPRRLELRKRARRIIAAGLFDSDWYLKQYPDVRLGAPSPVMHYLTDGANEGRWPHPMFDPHWYASQLEAKDFDSKTLVEHYLDAAPENRVSPHPLFDEQWYLENNPDVAEDGGAPLSHFLLYGGAEGRSPHPEFNLDECCKQNHNMDVPGINPKVHYLVSNDDQKAKTNKSSAIDIGRDEKPNIVSPQIYSKRQIDLGENLDFLSSTDTVIYNRRDSLGPILGQCDSSSSEPDNTNLQIRAELKDGFVEGLLIGADAPQRPEMAIELNGSQIWSGQPLSIRETFGSSFRVQIPPSLIKTENLLSIYTLKDGAINYVKKFSFGAESVLTMIQVGWMWQGDDFIIKGSVINEVDPLSPTLMRVEDGSGFLICEGLADLRSNNIADGFSYPFGGFLFEITSSFQWPLRVKAMFAGDAIQIAEILDNDEAGRSASCFVSKSSLVEGRVDRISQLAVMGWARSTNDPNELVFVDLLQDDKLIATVAAHGWRADLAKAFNDHGCHAFRIELTPAQAWQTPGILKVSSRKGQSDIRNSASFEPLYKDCKINAVQPKGNVLKPRSMVAGGQDKQRVSIIILNLNGAGLLQRFFASADIYCREENVEIIVVDHASSDESESICERWSEGLDIRFTNRGANYSFSDSNNFGAMMASGDVLLFCNNDVRFHKPIIADIVEGLGDDSVGIVGVHLCDDVPVPSLESASAPTQHLGVHIRMGSECHVIQAYESRYAQDLPAVATAPFETPAVTGALLGVRRSVFEELQGFDERYFYGQEDIDLCLKAQASGMSVVSLNQTSALHLRAYSRHTMSPKYSAVRERNRSVLDERFGFWLRRRVREDRFERPGFWPGRHLRVAFIVTENNPNTTAGDYFTACELAEALSSALPAHCVFIPHNSEDIETLVGVDVLISMRDDFDPRRVKRHDADMIRIAWVRNWFERFASRPFVRDFDEIWASSQAGANILSILIERDVWVLPIATNLERFDAGRHDSALACDYCFTGSFWGVMREAMHLLDPKAIPFDFKIFGNGWDKIPRLAPYAQGTVPYVRIPDVYASTKIVIDDANHVTKTAGSVNSRVFDALGAGCLVITNGKIGARETFGDRLPTFSTSEELEKLLIKFLSDEDERLRQVAELRDAVRGAHTYVDRSRRVVERLKAQAKKSRVAIKIAAPRRDVFAEWGDFHFADSLRQELESLGYLVRIDALCDWNNSAVNADDVVLVLRGLSAYEPKRHQINLMWMISHPDKITEDELNKYDHVFVASEHHAAALKDILNTDISFLPQCTDARRFNPEVPMLDVRPDVLFVGNSRNAFRRIVRDAIMTGQPLEVYGTRWHGIIPDRYIKGQNIPNSQLASYYRSANVVLNDHWDTMRDKGFISNRVFDVLASGGRLISDPVEGMQPIFGDMVEIYEGKNELSSLVAGLKSEPEGMQVERDRFAEKVLEKHSFGARARTISATIGALIQKTTTRCTVLS